MKYILVCILSICMSNIIIAQNAPATFTYKVGNIEVSLLNEVQNQGKESILIGASSEILKQTIPQGSYPSAVNTFLIKTPQKNILVDTGFGTKLFENLLTFGVEPEQIDIILLTHMHGDHIGGMLKDGIKIFSNAKVYIANAEYEYWMNEQKTNETANNIFVEYKEQIVLFNPVALEEEGNLLPEIKAIRAYGHTPGHTMYLVSSGNDSLLIWGDLTHALAVQMPYPQISVTYDVDPEQARLSRIATLKFVADKSLPVAGMHVPYPGMGKVTTEKENNYTFTYLKQ